MQEGSDRMQRFKIGLTFPGTEDQWLTEDQLDLNKGEPDRRGQSNSPKGFGGDGVVLGLRVPGQLWGFKLQISWEVQSNKWFCSASNGIQLLHPI